MALATSTRRWHGCVRARPAAPLGLRKYVSPSPRRRAAAAVVALAILAILAILAYRAAIVISNCRCRPYIHGRDGAAEQRAEWV